MRRTTSAAASVGAQGLALVAVTEAAVEPVAVWEAEQVEVMEEASVEEPAADTEVASAEEPAEAAVLAADTEAV